MSLETSVAVKEYGTSDAIVLGAQKWLDDLSLYEGGDDIRCSRDCGANHRPQSRLFDIYVEVARAIRTDGEGSCEVDGESVEKAGDCHP